jgi:hypothetical protein
VKSALVVALVMTPVVAISISSAGYLSHFVPPFVYSIVDEMLQGLPLSEHRQGCLVVYLIK